MEEYAGTDQCVKACIEHGVYFGDYVNEAELHESSLPCLITFGSARSQHVKNTSNVPVAMVGPYIAYAPFYLDEIEAASLKRRVGKTLLVFPSHSVDRVKVGFEQDALCASIDATASGYGVDTVLVCLYYRDILNGSADTYEKRGYRVVSAGYREDLLFLPRLKSLIEASDVTMSNSVGTHVGYCAFLGKPHYVIPQEKNYQASSAVDREEFDSPFTASVKREKGEVEAAFSPGTDGRNGARKHVCNLYWGFDKVLDRGSMATLLSLCDEAYRFRPQDRQEAFRSLIHDGNYGLEGVVV